MDSLNFCQRAVAGEGEHVQSPPTMDLWLAAAYDDDLSQVTR